MNYFSFVQTLRYFIKFDSLLNEEAEFHATTKSLKANGISIEKIISVIYKVAPTCSDLIVDCLWKSGAVPCHQLFTYKMTDDGLCCSLNNDFSMNKYQQ